MGNCLQRRVVAGVVTFVDLWAFTCCVPIVCQAWGAKSWFMTSLVLAMFLWIESLANLWRTGLRRVEHSRRASGICAPPDAPMICREGRNPNV